MNKNRKTRLFSRLAALAVTLVTMRAMEVGAAVSVEEAKQLGGPVLTEFGAERAANKDGSIPAYTGERVKAPASYDPKEPGRLPNAFEDKPLFSINAQNAAQYADKLTETQKAFLRIYPGYRMDIYPTRRTAYYPKYVLDNTLKNATNCTGGADELQLVGCRGGVMFPIPKTGNQAIWNHLTRYVGHAWALNIKVVYTTPDGRPIVQGVNQIHQEFPIYNPKLTEPAAPDDLYYKLRYDATGPARKAGEKVIFQFPMDPVNIGARVYQYLPGQRRVKLAPDIAYDTPSPQSGGASTIDENNIFFGAPDRYDFKLMGKKEIFILYNNFDANDYKKCPEEKFFKAGFVNPDCARWELHRVWVVNATLKPGFRHIYPKRVMYFDEDTWGAGAGDNYDAGGKLFRGDFVAQVPHYLDGPSPLHNNVLSTYTADVQNGGWYFTLFMAYPEGGIVSEKPKPETYYSPEALAGQGIR